MKKIFTLIFLSVFFLRVNAQLPGNNLGKTLSEMKRDFPELRYIQTDEKGDEYEDGYPEDGIALFFYFKNNKVIEECLICQSNDGFPLEWYRSLCADFSKKWNSSLRTNNSTYKEYVFPGFTVDIIYVSENNQNTALIVYSNQDASQSDVTRKHSQVPANNLRRTLSQIKQEFPNLEYTKDDNGYSVYKSDAEDEDFTSFYFKNGALVGQYTYIFDYNENYIDNLFVSLVNRCAKDGVKHYRNTSSNYDVIHFRYSYYTVKFANYGNQLQIYYELNGLNIKLNPLIERHLR